MKKIFYLVAITIAFGSCRKDPSIPKLDSPGQNLTYQLKNGGEVSVHINGKGEYVVGGDVILSKEQISYLEYNKVGSKTAPRSTFTAELQKIWPNGIVYYTNNDPGNSIAIADAIAHWEAHTPIRFVLRTNQSNYVDFAGVPTQGAGSSQLGMVGGRQEIRLIANAGFTTVVHEIGHAVGLMHEHLRADRDQYINVNYSNIQSSWTSQYAIYNPGMGLEHGSFDYNSVMIYPSYAGGPGNPAYPGNSTPQMTKKDGSTWTGGTVLSSGDIDGVNFIYAPAVFVKVITTYNVAESYYNIGITDEDVKQVYDVSVEFYSNASMTIPLTLTSPLKVKVESNGVTSYATIPSGNNTAYIGRSVDEYYTEYGVYRYHNTTTIGFLEAIGYKVAARIYL